MSDKTVVVIDDSPTLLKLVQLVLGELGVHVVPAATSDAAIDAMKAHNPQLVLLDDAFEDKPVEQVCERLAGAGTPPFILLRSGHGPSDPLKIKGVVDAIAKPFSPDALKALVSHQLGAPDASPPRRLALTPPPGFSQEVSNAAAVLQGNLSVFGAAELLGLVAESGKAGCARFARGRTAISVHFGRGHVAFARAEGVPEEFLLGRFLVERGHLTNDLLEAIVNGAGGKANRIGQRLLERGLISGVALDEALRLQTSNLFYELLRWEEGEMHFQVADQAPAGEPDLGLPVDQLLMEGLRRVDEWRLIEREVPSFDEVYLREEDRMSAMGPGKLLRDEVAVAELLNGKNTVKDVIFQSHIGSFEVCRVLYRLRKSKLIRPHVAPSVST